MTRTNKTTLANRQKRFERKLVRTPHNSDLVRQVAQYVAASMNQAVQRGCKDVSMVVASYVVGAHQEKCPQCKSLVWHIPYLDGSTKRPCRYDSLETAYKHKCLQLAGGYNLDPFDLGQMTNQEDAVVVSRRSLNAGISWGPSTWRLMHSMSFSSAQ